MKQWAQAFYLSQNWKDTSRTYMATQNYICERCGESAKKCYHKTYLTRDNINNQAIVNNLDTFEPPVQCKVSHFAYTCFCRSNGIKSGMSCKVCYRTAGAARA